MLDHVHGHILSDFTIDLLKAYLQNSSEKPKFSLTLGPFGQVIPQLNSVQDFGDALIIWTQVQAAIPSFQGLIDYNLVAEETLIKECDIYVQAIREASTKAKFVFVMSWTLPPFYRGLGPVDLKKGGLRSMLWVVNHRLIDRLSDLPNVFVLNTSRWTYQLGENAFNPKLWYLSKIPYDQNVFRLAAQDIRAALKACLGQSRKVILLDLDNTLWGGIVGETGWRELQIGGHDAVGEAYAHFQRTLKSYKNRGIILGIVSKNDEAVALDAISQHPEMVLKRNDFAGIRVNWDDKAANIVSLMKELNLGLDSAVFIDDNPAERDRIRKALPDVLVPEWPENPMLYTRSLLALDCFDSIFIAEEDRQRAEMYANEVRRRELRTEIQNVDEWLKSLDIHVEVERLSQENLPRAAQLLNKTNQMNLSTRRLTEKEFWDWSQTKGHTVWTFRVKDKLGDSGLVGIASVEIKDKSASIVDFVLSCRVFGRKIENVMTATVCEFAKKLCNQVQAIYLPTEKNKPCLEFFQKCGFESVDHTFSWPLKNAFSWPEHIRIERK